MIEDAPRPPDPKHGRTMTPQPDGPQIAHDIRGHLGTIANSAAVLRLVIKLNDPDAVQALAAIERQVAALRALADRLDPPKGPARFPAQ